MVSQQSETEWNSYKWQRSIAFHAGGNWHLPTELFFLIDSWNAFVNVWVYFNFS